MGGGGANATRRTNARLAKNYDSYLKNLKDSMRGAKTDKDADRLIKQAKQTNAYLVFLQKQSLETAADRAAFAAVASGRAGEPRGARVRTAVEAGRSALPLQLGAGPDFMLERHIADPQDGADRQGLAARPIRLSSM